MGCLGYTFLVADLGEPHVPLIVMEVFKYYEIFLRKRAGHISEFLILTEILCPQPREQQVTCSVLRSEWSLGGYRTAQLLNTRDADTSLNLLTSNF